MIINKKPHLLKKEYQEKGTVLFDLKSSFFRNIDFETLKDASENIPYETVHIGDAGEENKVEVGRFMTDVDKPEVVNNQYSKKVLNILNDIKYKKIFGEIISYEKELYVRRVQVNKMYKDSFIGYHLDVDSNPDYLAAVVIQIGAEFEGGDYVVYTSKEDKNPNVFKPFYESMIISNCLRPHEVTKIVSGERISLVFFLCSHDGNNKRAKN
jgi:hypothetical protein|tara:strand:+ start:3824 stop:4456 length:633 start_codon:yes stop_codon:yes gene_type:complete